jgi:hypothetical protein
MPAVATLSFKPAADRASRTRLLCLCWTGFLLTFFTFSSTQEYYSMPCYPALALLLGAALTEPRAEAWVRRGYVALSVIAALCAIAIGSVLAQVWNMPAPGDISRALLTQQVAAYTLSLGHMGDLTIHAFAYLRTPLLLAGIAFLIGAVLSWQKRLAGAVIMMVLFVHAARMALVVFDPYLSSAPLAEALNAAPHGKLILDDQYYTFSSVIFYAEKYHGEHALLLNGRVNNLEYGSYEPGAPQDIFINDPQFHNLWLSQDLYYICVEGPEVKRLETLVGKAALHKVAAGGGKYLFANRD